MTSGKEDYLKALYTLGDDGHVVSNKDLSDLLEVSPPSTSEMIARLQKEGYIDYQAYKGSRLTEKGRREAARMIRYHCLWEVFLVRHLGFCWSEAHREAHQLEHHVSEETIRRLDAFLGYPVYCPHGTPIPAADGTHAPQSTRRLIDLNVGDRSRIGYCREDMELMDYLQSAGIEIGMEICVTAKEPYEGPIRFSAKGREYFLSYKAAKQLFVDEAE